MRAEKVLTSPSDFVEAVRSVRIVHTKTNEGQTDLFLALSKTEDFCQLYGTSEGIKCFLHFIKTQNSLHEYRYSSHKKSIQSIALSMKFFEPLLRRLLFQKLLRCEIKLQIKD